MLAAVDRFIWRTASPPFSSGCQVEKRFCALYKPFIHNKHPAACVHSDLCKWKLITSWAATMPQKMHIIINSYSIHSVRRRKNIYTDIYIHIRMAHMDFAIADGKMPRQRNTEKLHTINI